MNLNDLNVSAKLKLGFGILLGLMLVVAGNGWLSLDRMQGAVEQLAEEHVPTMTTASGWQISVLQSARRTRNVLILDEPEAVNKELAALQDERTARKQYMDKLAKLLTAEDEKLAYKAVVDAHAAYVPLEDEFIKLAAAGDRPGAKKLLLERGRQLQLQYVDTLQAFLRAQEGAVSEASDQSARTYASARNLAIGLVVAALAIGLAVGFWLARSMLKQLGGEPRTAAELACAVAHGDLSGQIDVRPGDTTSLMAQLRDMQASLIKVVSNVRENAEGVATASAQIAQGNSDLSRRTEQQAGALQETASSMEELSSTVKQNADNAKQANQLALGASSVAVKGGEVVGQVVDTMKGINESSTKIAEIIGVIDGIAFQTNILALNAAVEAARAGEQGRGFAVVASEVRSLAQRSAEAAKQIKELISASVKRVEQGTQLVDRAGVTMTEIVNSIGHVTDIMGEISSASIQQSAGVAQVSDAINQMDTGTQQNAALVEQGAAAAEGLRTQAQQMVQAVAVFRLRGDDAGRSEGARARPAATPSPGGASPDRRGPGRAKNVLRPGFKPSAARVATPAASGAPVKTASGEWQSF